MIFCNSALISCALLRFNGESPTLADGFKMAMARLPQIFAWALVSGVASGVFAVSFSVLSSSAALEIRGRVMSFAYVPVNVGFLVGAALGTLVTAGDVFVIFPITAVVTALGTVALVIASRRLDESAPRKITSS